MLMGRFPEPDVMIDGILAMRHRLDRHDAFVRHLLSRVTAKLAERSFAAGLRRDRQLAFEHDLGKRGHFQIDSLTSYDIYWCSSETAGNLQFIATDAGLKLRRDIHRRWDADTNRDFELFLAALLGVFDKIVTVMARRKANGDFVLRNQHHPIDRQVLTVLRIFDDHVSRRDIR